MNPELAFKGIYKAAGFLLGRTLKHAGIPAYGLPGLVLNFHSPHALALFRAIRADKKYGARRDQLRDIQKAMAEFAEVLRKAIAASSPLPDIPETDAANLFQRNPFTAFQQRVDEFITSVRFFISVLDAVLDDLSRCILAWNETLASVESFLEADAPKNAFEAIGHAAVRREMEWTWFEDVSSFSGAASDLVNHRNAYAKLIDVGRRGPLRQLEFGRPAVTK